MGEILWEILGNFCAVAYFEWSKFCGLDREMKDFNKQKENHVFVFQLIKFETIFKSKNKQNKLARWKKVNFETTYDKSKLSWYNFRHD